MASSSQCRLQLTFRGWLPELLREDHLDGRVSHLIHRRASIKDVVESLGIPHTEVGEVHRHERAVDFSCRVADGDIFVVSPLRPPVDVTLPTLLRPRPLPAARFVVDVNVGRLAGLLRLAGLDTAYENTGDDPLLAAIACREQRILLTRDRRLLHRRIVEHGHYVREKVPELQLAEVVGFYGLAGKLRPFSRCLRCNGVLEPVAKEEIIHRLLPLTRRYYHVFRRCPGCGRIYWPGSHHARMAGLLASLGKDRVREPAG
ncbi:MAG: Mut7-C RNAse domain-containing protein [Thermodesulfobacteriota bacterium]